MNWQSFHEQEEQKEYFRRLTKSLRDERKKFTVYPPETKVYRAFSLTPFSEVKVVILGQDPYHGEGQADGLAFSSLVPPPSLRNIFKELHSDLEVNTPLNGDLSSWAKEGVLLLNTQLTVRANKANSHKGIGWETYTDNVIKYISENKDYVVFILWGKNAQSKEKLIANRHGVIKSVHPSPLAAYRGFFGSKPFSKTNELLQANNYSPIKWVK